MFLDPYLKILDNYKDPQVSFKWSNVGVLDYDPNTDAWLVQRLDDNGRILNEKGNPVSNGGAKDESRSVF